MSLVIKVGLASCGLAAGAGEVYNAIQKHIKKNKIDAELKKTACIGMCFVEPLVEIYEEEKKSITYGDVTPKNVGDIIDAFSKGKPIEENVIISNILKGSENKTFKKQKRIVLRNCGIIDPISINDYLEKDGYSALEKSMKNMTREEIIDEIKNSGLRGRGGAGFPTGLKWQFAYNAQNDKKYIVCNADEGDPGAFMDRSVLEGDPHSVIEGMIIGAYAIGADEGYIYCRAEYPLAIKHLEIAIEQATEKGYIRNKIFGTDFNF